MPEKSFTSTVIVQWALFLDSINKHILSAYYGLACATHQRYSEELDGPVPQGFQSRAQGNVI